MPRIAPFRAVRYDAQRAGALGSVLSQPYDVIGPEEQQRLYDASPYNVVRLILGKQEAGDDGERNWYARARDHYAEWQKQGILRRDEAPALYLVAHEFAYRGASYTRWGFTARMALDESTQRSVHKHEATLAAAKADRTRLLEAIPANLEPIFCVYPDAEGAVQRMLTAAAAKNPPSSEAKFRQDSIRLWVLTDAALIGSVAEHLGKASVLIADGHHRFEVASANSSRYNNLMTYFVSMADPSLVVRPIHRCVLPESGKADAIRQLCELQPEADVAALLRWLEAESRPGRFGFADRGSLYRASIRPEVAAAWMKAPSVPAPVAGLDVSLLHGAVLPKAGVESGSVKYTADAEEAVAKVRGGQAQMCWLLRGIPLDRVYALASQGITLAAKSTYFHPKILSGLTINPLTDPA